ncbi:apolipoprotein C-I [Hoplias malabaricus]|uniref:apolipoprotein C-I n=1 Tax=Hoplias malabaricus TaxID=27720 RepID=UPI00346253BF
MRLYLAVAALMLVLAAQTEAQESTIGERFSDFHTKVMEFGQDLSEKTVAAFKKIEESEFATKSKNWLTEQFGKIKQTFQPSD